MTGELGFIVAFLLLLGLGSILIVVWYHSPSERFNRYLQSRDFEIWRSSHSKRTIINVCVTLLIISIISSPYWYLKLIKDSSTQLRREYLSNYKRLERPKHLSKIKINSALQVSSEDTVQAISMQKKWEIEELEKIRLLASRGPAGPTITHSVRLRARSLRRIKRSDHNSESIKPVSSGTTFSDHIQMPPYRIEIWDEESPMHGELNANGRKTFPVLNATQAILLSSFPGTPGFALSAGALFSEMLKEQ